MIIVKVTVMKIVIFDKNSQDKLPDPIQSITVENLFKQVIDKKPCETRVAFISSANSLLFFDGGSDMGYMSVIHNVQQRAQHGAHLHGQETNLGRSYIPIGVALGIKLKEYENTFLVCCPTMFMPQSVTETRNPFYAFTAGLNWCWQQHIDVVYTPTMCTNFGGMTFQESLNQMIEAVDTFKTINGHFIQIDDTYSVWSLDDNKLDQIRDQQPKIYMNSEFNVELC